MARTKQPPAIRRQRIIELVEASDFIVPGDIAESLGVSSETIRRDLVTLERSGSLRRVHGGAVHEAIGSSEPDRPSRTAFRMKEKRAIAKVAVGLIGPTDSIFLDVGTTVEAVAEALPRSFRGTVITNSLHVAFILGDRENITLDLLGGRIRIGEFTTAGPDALEQTERFNADLAFLGAGGVSLLDGVTDYSIEDAAVKQAMLSRATRSFVVAGSEKIGRKALRAVCSLNDVTAIITDGALDNEVVASFSEAGASVLTPRTALLKVEATSDVVSPLPQRRRSSD